MKRKSGPPEDKNQYVQQEEEEDAAMDDGVIQSSRSADELEDARDTLKAAKRMRTHRSSANPDSGIAGVIDSVTLVNFMSHRHFKLRFGPRVNFVTGPNGSGKSAILTGITVCMGGRANATNRASNLKGLIREGADSAEVSIKIRNLGRDAFRPEVYGDSIIIERRFTRDGPSGYKIRNADGKVVSTRREDLNAICDHMALQPDNPMLIMNQDASRQFLMQSTEEGRYMMFMRGTQLEDLKNDYVKLKTTVDKLGKLMEDKKKITPDLESQLRSSKQRLKEMQAAISLERKIESLKRQIAWSQVYDKEEEARKEHENVGIATEKLAMVQSNSDEALGKLRQLETDYQAVEEKINKLAVSIKPIEVAREEKKAEFGEVDRQIRKVDGDIKMLNKQVHDCNAELSDLSRKIETEQQQQMRTADLELKAKKKQELKTVQSEFDVLREKLIDLREKQNHGQSEARVEELRSKSTETRQAVEMHYRTIRQIEDKIQKLEAAKRDRVCLFGRQVPEMLREIDAAHRKNVFRGGMPIGPIGMHITVPDPRKWAFSLDAIIGPNIPFAFIVQDSRDIQPLQQIFEKYKYGEPDRNQNVRSVFEVFCARPDRSFNYAAGKPTPSPDYTTAIDQLEIDNQLVLQTLINSFNLERIIMTETRVLGEKVMRNWPAKVKNCFDRDGNRIGSRSGGNANFYMGKKSSVGGFAMLSAQDHDSQIERLREELQDLNSQLEHVKSVQADTEKELRLATDSQTKMANQVRAMNRRLQGMEQGLKKLKDELEEMESDNSNNLIMQLIEERKALEAQKETLANQFQPLTELRERLIDSRRRVKAEDEEILQTLRAQQEKIDQDKEALSTLGQRKLKASTDYEHYHSRLEKYQTVLNAAQTKFEEITASAEADRQKALEFCENQQIEKAQFDEGTTEALSRALRTSMARLKERENEIGSLEDALKKFKEREDALAAHKQDIKNTNALYKELSNSLSMRAMGWSHFRAAIVMRAKFNFRWLLERRKYRGELKFDHERGRLIVNVETNEQQQRQMQRADEDEDGKGRSKRDPRGLSGGEKSFSTICLLLSIWSAMNSPVRALDEFDVFMDPVNRRLSMAMLIETALTEGVQTQYILITPQGLDTVKPNAHINIQRLVDPRSMQNQSTLPVVSRD